MKNLLLYLTLSFLPLHVFGQQDEAVYYGRRYVSLNIRSLEKYTRRIDRQQQRLLGKLKRQETRIARQLKRTDSAAYARYTEQTQALSFDSISRIQKHPETIDKSVARKPVKAIDSLRRVQQFLGRQTGLGTGTELAGADQLQAQLNTQQYLNGLIQQRQLNLKSLATHYAHQVPALKGLEKDIFYGKGKMAEWKKVADEPSVAEEKALEYLQGTKGFSFAEEKAGMQAAGNEADLERMGFQTKRQLNEQLQKQFGDNLGNMQQQMGKQVSDWQQQSQQLTGAVKKTQQQVNTTKDDIAATKNAAKQLTKTKPLDFKVNPMRGLPFWKRVEKGYSFNTFRATPDGKRPAILDLAGTTAFKHTPKLSYGLGAGVSIGLGQNWSNIRFSYEGVSLRAFATYEALLGIAAYAGYERLFLSGSGQRRLAESNTSPIPYNEHNTATYSEAVLLGLSKKYRINDKWNGAIQLLYDVWWREKGMNSPVVLRLLSTKP